MTFQSLPRDLALFPLRSAILLPRGRMPLNVFEPRYLSMTEYALGHGRMIGMIRPRCDDDVNPPLYDVGCAGRISSFAETEDGRFLLTLTGVSRFKIRSEALARGGFRLGEVDYAPFSVDAQDASLENPALRERVVELLMEYLNEVGLSADWDSIEGASAETIVNSVSMSCPFDPDEKQALLEAPTLVERSDTLIALMEMSIAAARSERGEDISERLQ